MFYSARELGKFKISTHWVPRLLTDKKHRVRCSDTFLSRYDEECCAYLDTLITTDETWLYRFDPQTKSQK